MGEVRTTCPYCGVGCGVVVKGGEIKGDPDHPANFGRLCSKGAALAETLGDSGRLLRPRIAGEDASWDTALDLVAARFQKTIAARGPGSVAFYVSGQFLTEDYYVANKLMKGFIGSANIDTNSRLCMASTVAGHSRAFGADIVPGIYEDWDEADLVVLAGTNAAWCHPVLFQRLKDAKRRRGTRIIVIDPRRTATCEIADLHLPLKPGSDVALFDGLLLHLAKSGAVNPAWIGAHTTGFEAALEAASRCGTIVEVKRTTGLPEADIVSFYRAFAETERALTVFSQGVNQSSSGTDKVNAIINCHLATGRIGRPGMGPFSVTGQPNAMGGREVGGLANQLAAHMRFDRLSDVDRVERFWTAPSMARKPGLKAVDMFDAVHDGRIEAIWIMATNPAASMPNAGRVRRALERCPFVVVSDCWPTDTTSLAHVVLPAAAWGEKSGTVTNSERRISRQRAFRSPVGEAKADWWIMSEVARRMGWAQAFPYCSPVEIFREHAALSCFENDGARPFDLGALSSLDDAAYEAFTPERWPLRGASDDVPSERLFGDGRFPTTDGKARFIPTPWIAPAARPTRQRPFILNTGRLRDQWHTMTRTGRAPRLMAHQDEPWLELHPADANKLGVAEGDLVQLRTEYGAAILRARPTDAQSPGEVFAPIHWTDDFGSTGTIDRLVSSAVDPISGQPELKATAAALAPRPTLWRAVLVGGAGPKLDDDFYHVRIPLHAGNSWELRGWNPLPHGEHLTEFCRRLLGGSDSRCSVEQIDKAALSARFADLDGGRLRSFLALSADPRHVLPDRGYVAERLGKEVDESCRQALFAMESARSAPAERPRTICVCFSVNATAIARAISEFRCRTAGEIGAALRAGTNCGSCLPEIEAMLQSAKAGAQAPALIHAA